MRRRRSSFDSLVIPLVVACCLFCNEMTRAQASTTTTSQLTVDSTTPVSPTPGTETTVDSATTDNTGSVNTATTETGTAANPTTTDNTGSVNTATTETGTAADPTTTDNTGSVNTATTETGTAANPTTTGPVDTATAGPEVPAGPATTGAGNTETSRSDATDGAASQAPDTTPAPPTITTTPINAKPPRYDSVRYTIALSVIFDDENGGLTAYCTPSQANCSSAIQDLVDTAFRGCPGTPTISVTSFGGVQIPARASLFSDMQEPSFFSVQPFVANYNATFAGDFFLTTQPEEITNYIASNLTSALDQENLFGYQINSTATQAAITEELKDQGNTWLADPCDKNTDVCDQCYKCNGTYDSLQCPARCSNEENKFCQVLNTVDTVCSCRPYYLPVSGDCVHQNVIIGLTAGLGGAFVIALIVTIIVLVCKRGHHSSRRSSTSSGKSLRRASAVESQFQGAENVAFNRVEMQNVDSNKGKTVDAVDAGEQSSKPVPQQKKPNSDTIVYEKVDGTKKAPVESPRYVTEFQAQLRNVDVDASFSFKRPQVVDPTTVPMPSADYQEFL